VVWNATPVVSRRSKGKHHIKSMPAHRILEHTSSALLRARIHHTTWELDRVSQELLQTYFSVSAKLIQHDFGYGRHLHHGTVCLTFSSPTEKQKQKFKHWYIKKPLTEKIDAKKVAINLTGRELEPPAVSVLSKGLDFA